MFLPNHCEKTNKGWSFNINKKMKGRMIFFRHMCSKIWPFLSFWYTPDSNMKTSMKNMWGELMFASCSILNILLCWVLYSLLQKTFLQCHFYSWFVINCLLNVFTIGSKVGGCSRCRNLLWKWLSLLTRDSNRWWKCNLSWKWSFIFIADSWLEWQY